MKLILGVGGEGEDEVIEMAQSTRLHVLQYLH